MLCTDDRLVLGRAPEPDDSLAVVLAKALNQVIVQIDKQTVVMEMQAKTIAELSSRQAVTVDMQAETISTLTEALVNTNKCLVELLARDGLVSRAGEAVASPAVVPRAEDRFRRSVKTSAERTAEYRRRREFGCGRITCKGCDGKFCRKVEDAARNTKTDVTFHVTLRDECDESNVSCDD